jgi:hypothetical protein
MCRAFSLSSELLITAMLSLACLNRETSKLSSSWNADSSRLLLWPENLPHCA